jgi:lysophospholipase L1-like esterase
MARRTVPLAAVAFLLAIAIVVMGSRAAQGTTDLLTSTTASTTTDGTTASTATKVTDDNDDGVKRVVVVGDSLVVGAEPELIASFAANDVEYRFIAVSGTGLLTDQGVRLTELETALEEFHPDVVIIESCCNYDGTYTMADGTVVAGDSDLLWEAWADQARLMVSAAQAHDADVYVVITPRPIDDSWFTGLTNRVARFNAVYRSLGVPLIDWDAALYPDGGSAGLGYLRNADGLHLSDAGDDLVAAATWSAIAPSFG